ncbi:MAG: DUF2911 domain-containing protein [Balneolaceae bacterium]
MFRPVLYGITFMLVTFGFSFCANAQDVRLSQKGSVSQYINDTEKIEIIYNRPVARGRTLFGPDGIVSFGRIWMPGANEASTIEFSTDVTVNSQPLNSGRYSIWTIPGADDWTVILSNEPDVWHTNYPEGKDAIKFSVTPEKGGHIETMTFYFAVVEPGEASLHLHWGETIVPIEIRI